VVRERERGNIEQILVTPIRSAEFMLGKMFPTATIAIVNLLTILAIGVFWFDVPFQGNFWLFLWLALLYVLSGLGLGLLVSAVSQNQKQALQLVGVTTMIPVDLLYSYLTRHHHQGRRHQFSVGTGRGTGYLCCRDRRPGCSGVQARA
jgi:ABC-2 type transport system permease protein